MSADEGKAPAKPQGFIPQRSRVTAGLLAIFFGALGMHKFYLGYIQTGFIMLAVSIVGSLLSFGTAFIVMAVVGVIEGALYLSCSPEDFEATYVRARREWL